MVGVPCYYFLDILLTEHLIRTSYEQQAACSDRVDAWQPAWSVHLSNESNASEIEAPNSRRSARPENRAEHGGVRSDGTGWGWRGRNGRLGSSGAGRAGTE